MSIEPWKVMVGLSGLLVAVGAGAILGVSTTGEVVLTVGSLGFVVVTTYVGYRIGRNFGPGSSN